MAIGKQAGQTDQQSSAVAIGDNAGKISQQGNAVAIGANTGQTSQSASAVAIGNSAGYSSQLGNAIALGTSSGEQNQGTNAIAIGQFAGKISQPDNSIVINASGATLNGANTSALYINPIRSDITPTGATGTLMYDTTSSEVYCNTAKTFVIPHPTEESKYLVHGCLEGPEAGVYYRGKAEILNESIEISLPSYATSFNNFTINLTPIKNKPSNNENGDILNSVLSRNLEVSEVENNKFTVYGNPGSFYWLVHATRLNIEVEPLRSDVTLKGDGPYTYL